MDDTISSEKRYNHILKVIDDHLVPDSTAKAQRGEVFTPPDLVREMLFGLRKDKLDKGETEIFGLTKDGKFAEEDESNRVGGLPTEVWRNPDLKWLDPANGIGNFPIIAFYKLDHELSKVDGFKDADKRRKHIIENMLYMIELDKGNCVTCRGVFKKICPSAKINICCANTLSLTWHQFDKSFGFHEFDIIMGNPPFNPPKTETGSSGNSIWQNFVMKAFFMLSEKGYLCFVHPPGWKKPTDKKFKPDEFSTGDFRGQIRQGAVWQSLKDIGTFKFIYTNDQRFKGIGKEYLEHFPAVDYYIYQKNFERSTCDTKNIFFGEINYSLDVKLNYKLSFLPNLINKTTQIILDKLTSKSGEKPNFKAGFDPRGFKSKEKGAIKYIYDASSKGPNYSFFREKAENVDISKVVLNENGGINGFFCDFIDKSEEIGVLHHTLFFPVEKRKGINIKKFFNSDIVRFIFLITQYSSGKMTTNEKLVANSLTIPPIEVKDYYKFFDIEKYKDYIEKTLEEYEKFKAPKRKGTQKAKHENNIMDGGARTFFDKTRKRRRI